MGRPMAILRIGGRVPSATSTTFDACPPPLQHFDALPILKSRHERGRNQLPHCPTGGAALLVALATLILCSCQALPPKSSDAIPM